jgi:hypothetical protein
LPAASDPSKTGRNNTSSGSIVKKDFPLRFRPIQSLETQESPLPPVVAKTMPASDGAAKIQATLLPAAKSIKLVTGWPSPLPPGNELTETENTRPSDAITSRASVLRTS